MTTRNRTVLLAIALLTVVVFITAGFSSWREGLERDLQWHIMLTLQLPVLLTAVLVGAALAVSAGTLQVVLRNPLADPGIIGITSGASLVAAFILLIGPASDWLPLHYLLPVGCFVGALLSTFLIYRLALRLATISATVILSGIAISTISGAIVAWLYLFADAQSMRNLTFWLMGSLYQADWLVVVTCGPVIVICLAILISKGQQLNWLYAGEIQAAAAGVSPQNLIRTSLLASAFSVGAAVSMAGSIAFIGLLVPHFLRLLLGNDNRLILPASALVGATILLCVVCLTETWQQTTLPVSMITATVGGPLLLYALYRGQLR